MNSEADMLAPTLSDSGKCSHGNRRRGSAAVEFAFIAPLMLLLTVGMIEVTRVAQVKVVLGDAVRHGCRLATEARTNNDMVKNSINSVLTNNGIKSADATIDIKVNNVAGNVQTAKEGDRIQVSITIAVSKVSWMAPLIFPSTAQQVETLSMLRQR